MADTEKITINMSVVDLGQIDLLVEQGFFSSRTDFIRTAVRNLLTTHGDNVKETVVRRSFVVGALFYGAKDLDKLKAAGQKLDIRAVGVVELGKDISPDLACDTIETIKIYGVLRASDAVKAALADRLED